MMIWDVHCHLSGVPGGTPDERLAQFIAFADRMGIERICVFMGMNWSYDPSPDDMRKQNDEVLAALERWHHRAFGFVYLNPNHVEASLAELDRCVRDGPMVGVKLWVARHPAVHHQHRQLTGPPLGLVLPGASVPAEPGFALRPAGPIAAPTRGSPIRSPHIPICPPVTLYPRRNLSPSR
jgi:hypothetical protein